MNETEDFVPYTVDEIVNYNYDHIYIDLDITAMSTFFDREICLWRWGENIQEDKVES